MRDKPTINKLSKITYLTFDDINHFITKVTNQSGTKSIGFLNQYGFNLMETRAEVRESFNSVDYLLRDGIGVKIACKISGVDPKDNMNGTDFIPLFIERYLESKSLVKAFVYGTEEPWLTKGSHALFGQQEVSVIDGFQDPEVYIEHFESNANKDGENIILLAMGMPKQEALAQKIKALNCGNTVILCGGAVVDFYANKVTRAPGLYRKLGLEWFYRLLQEPKRMANRYIIGIPKFLFYTVRGLV